eukprot:CAMPEP_0119342812 /NCGR_PEP_ID=MMETSP1333-20130426/105472_1 /TAXON_ID=418940 /ORGANISM="Scyphosphaera apsteinii, Strain RCC1455" /LENGTH=267 /DNA_ID=CAMNT_0007355103 /DNA_START=35 /DNA_END=838 /DNA_ORIENTATION=-
MDSVPEEVLQTSLLPSLLDNAGMVAGVCHLWHNIMWTLRLSGSDSDICIQAIRALIRLGPATILLQAPLLLERLEHRGVMVRHSAVVALSALGTQWVSEHITPFLGLMEDPDEDISFIALCALTKLPCEELVQHAARFRACLKHPSPAARCGALQALSGIGPAAVAKHSKPIIAKLGDPDPQVRRSAAVALAVLPRADVPARATTALRKRLESDDEDPRVRTSVLETLAKHEQSAQDIRVDVTPGLQQLNLGVECLVPNGVMESRSV